MQKRQKPEPIREPIGKAIKGRGANLNPRNRFEKLSYHADIEDDLLQDRSRPSTEFFHDTSRTILSENNSPDIGFRYSINPYRGCEHGCAYCYASLSFYVKNYRREVGGQN
jgi:radical SAM superfamily enzyme YgiQ (UPF0313 family)